jgi:hypothetical protein
MRISKTALWLSVLVAFLVLIASSAGLSLKSLYARETMSWTVQAYGQDIANRGWPKILTKLCSREALF